MQRSIMIAIFAVFAVTGLAQETPQGRPPEQNVAGGSPMRHMRMLGMSLNEELFSPEMVMQNQQSLKLTDEQKKSILEAMKTFSSQFTELQWKLNAEQEIMSALLKQEQIDEAKTLAQLDKLMGIENDIKRLNLANMIRIRNLLTAEQKTALRSIRQSTGCPMGESRERRGNPKISAPPKPQDNK
jgi:Spy/CpxP family protein refolding chaperone